MSSATTNSFLRNAAQLPLYVWPLALYPVALIAVMNRSQVAGNTVLFALAIAVAAATVGVVVFRLLLGSWHKAALYAAITIALFYAFGPISMGIDSWWLEPSDRGDSGALGNASRAPLLLSVLWLIVLTAAFVLLRRTQEARIARLAAPLNLVSGLLVATVAAQSLSSSSAGAVDESVASLPAPVAQQADETLPDIYYVILDGYARGDVLEQYYEHDNAPFLDALRESGFTIDERSNANYYWTFLSLASSLNMDYVPAILGPIQDRGSVDRGPAYEHIRNSAVAKTLRGRGYRFIQLQSTWGATLANPHADTLISCGDSLFADEFFRTLAEASWLRALTALASARLADCHNKNFESLAGVAAEPGPKFVFAHFLLPHHPYLFDRHGNVLHDATIANQFQFQAKLWEQRDRYLDQLLYVNDAVLKAVSRIKQTSARPPVIIVQSDHGPQLKAGLDEAEQRRVRFANLAAFHLPGAPPDLIPQGDSPVNIFRHILGFYLDADLPPLPNRHFYSAYGRPFGLKDVTDQIEQEPRITSAAAQ